jgi:acetyl coenzyme A synthetase (ADP forming)-like protein
VPIHRPLDPVFSPRSIAVVGASRNPSSIGFALLHNLVLAGFEGPLYPVNPRARSIHSLPCYPSLAALPEAPDLVVVLVPRDLVLPVVEEAVARGARALVVISAGFGETGGEGARLEAQLRATVRAAGVRMIGPNCMGVINTDPEVRMNATFAPVAARRGSLGFVSQSGALGVAILNVAASLGIGLTQFVSMGNKADVSGNDLLEHWEDDPATRVLCMYLESFGNPRRFTEIAKRVSRKKPILVVKSGRTEAGARAASSHTGAMAGADVTVSAFLAQCGVLRADTIEELFDVARALDRCPLPHGRRVAIVTNAGGPAIMATDACVNLGLPMAELAEATRAHLASYLPAAASLANPVDMIASATPESYRETLAAVLADPGVDLALVVNVTPLMSDPTAVLEAATAAAATVPGKPVLAVMMATEEFYSRSQGREDLLPVYRFPESAALALAQLCRYAEWRERPEEAPPELPADDARVAALLAATPEGYLPTDDAFAVLDAYGIPVAPWRLVGSLAEVEAAAAELGWPVVLKAVGRDLVHKSELGAVAVDLRTPVELATAGEAMAARLAAAGVSADSWLVQRLVRGGQEVIFGLSTDPRFGPLLMFGLGGKYVEVLRDVRFAVTPLSRSEAAQTIRGIQGVRLLEGVRGDAPADLARLEDVLLRLAQLVTRHPRVTELDINPFLAAPEGKGSVALDVRIRVAAAAQG